VKNRENMRGVVVCKSEILLTREVKDGRVRLDEAARYTVMDKVNVDRGKKQMSFS